MEDVPAFDLLAAALRADARDVGSFVDALAGKLEASFPDAVSVERKGSLLGRKRARRLSLDLGQHSYELVAEAAVPRAYRRTVVKGIALKNEELAIDDWIDSLSRELVAEAERGERARVALERLLT